MYFDFWDNRPDTPRLSSPMTPREKGLATLVVHLLLVILILVWPEIPWVKQAEARRQQELEAAELRRLEERKQHEDARFVFMQPRMERPVPPPERAELSDLDRRAQSVERPVEARNPLPFARGNTTERIDAEAVNGPRAPAEPPAPPVGGDDGEAARELPALPESTNGVNLRPPDPKPANPGPRTGILADAIRNVQKYAGTETFDNLQGGAPNENFPSIQFDAKGVEFGPWLRRFIAQIRRNWFIPYAAMTMKGHVVLTFNVHKDGRITDLTVVKPSSVEGFTHSARNALAASNPTVPLPPEYPDDRAFFTVTFYFNETPPR